MPEPRFVYLVTALVVLALVAWVIVVLVRPDNAKPAEGPARPQGPDNSNRQRLDSHLEIQDDPKNEPSQEKE